MIAAALFLLALALQPAPPSPAAQDAFENFENELERTGPVAREIAAMFAMDQAARFAIIAQFQRGDLTESDRAWLSQVAGQIIDDIDERNTDRLKAILEATSWEEIDAMQGGRILRFAWSLVSHANHDPAFQSDALAQLERLQLDGGLQHLNRSDFANVYDKVALTEGRLQRYGTQLDCESGDWQPFDVEAPEALAARRRDMGLEPLQDYITSHRDLYGECPSG